MRLSPAAFNRFLTHIGQQVEWREASACPCLNVFSGAADPACPLCRGKGHTWAAAMAGVVGVAKQEVNPEWRDFGNFEAGDMTLTVGSDSPLYLMGRFDRIVLMNSSDRFSRVLVRGENDVLDIRVKQITRVFWLNPAKTARVEGSVPEWDPATGALSWPGGVGEPPVGTQYSITGDRFDEYFVWQALPSDRNEHKGSPLPRRVQARKWDLFGR